MDDNGVGVPLQLQRLKDRHTAVEVILHRDPQNGCKTSTELVEDPEAILRYGRQPAEDGCVRLHQSRSGPPCRAVG